MDFHFQQWFTVCARTYSKSLCYIITDCGKVIQLCKSLQVFVLYLVKVVFNFTHSVVCEMDRNDSEPGSFIQGTHIAHIVQTCNF